MARPQKEGLEYFPLDVVMDDNVELIEAEHGLVGFGVLIKLFQKIYSEGYYYPWTEKEQLLFSNKISTDKNTVVSIVSDCIKWGIFSKQMYERYRILTSEGIQKRYLAAIYKRTKINMIGKYLLIDISDRNNVIAVGVTDSKNEDTNMVTDSKSTQSKVKESKVKNSKEESNVSKTETLSQDDKSINLCEYYSKLKPGQSIAGEIPTLKIWIEMYGYEWVLESMQMCVSQKGRFIRPWIEKVLKNWKSEGHTTQRSANNVNIDIGMVKVGSRVYDIDKLEKQLLGREGG